MKHYAIRKNTYKTEKQKVKKVVEAWVDIDSDLRKKIEEQITRYQKALQQGKIKRKVIKEVNENVQVVDKMMRSDKKYKTYKSALKDLQKGEFVDFFDELDWHENVKQEMNGDEG